MFRVQTDPNHKKTHKKTKNGQLLKKYSNDMANKN